MPGSAEDRGGRAALDALRRGRPDPAPLHAACAGASARSPRACGARAAASAGGWSRSSALRPRAARGARRAADGDGAETIEPPRRGCARTRARSTRRRAPATRSSRLFETGEPHPGVFNLLCRELGAARRASPAAATPGQPALAFRLKLLLAAGLAPQLARVRVVRRGRAPRRLLGAAGGVVCGRARRRRSRSARRRTSSWPARSARRSREAPDADERGARPGGARDHRDAEHHAHVRLRAAAA